MTLEAFSVTLKVEGTLEELRRLFLGAAERELKETAKRAGKKVVKKTVKAGKKKLSKWHKFLRSFKFRNRKRNESPATYMGLRTKAASRAYKKKNGTKKGQVRKTARRAYER